MKRISKARWKDKWERDDHSEALKKYIKRGVFFHMSDLGPGAINTDRFGINPKQGWDTPFGIYGYPLDKERYNQLLAQNLPFRADAPWVHVFAIDLQKCVIASKYRESNLNRDLDQLTRMGFSTADMRSAITQAYVQTPAGKLWNVTRTLVGGSITKWNKLFRQLGYQSFWDDKCQGIIHQNEKCQAVVFSTGAAKRLDVVPNPSTKGDYSYLGFKPAPNTISKLVSKYLKGWNKSYYSYTLKLYVEGVGVVMFSLLLDEERTTFTLSVVVGYEEYPINLEGSLSTFGAAHPAPLSKFSNLYTRINKALQEISKKAKDPLNFDRIEVIPSAFYRVRLTLTKVSSYYVMKGDSYVVSLSGQLGDKPKLYSQKEADALEALLDFEDDVSLVPVPFVKVEAYELAKNPLGWFLLVDTDRGFILSFTSMTDESRDAFVISTSGNLIKLTPRSSVEEMMFFPSKAAAVKKAKRLYDNEVKNIKAKYPPHPKIKVGSVDWYSRWVDAKKKGLSREDWLKSLAISACNSNATRTEALKVLINASSLGFEDEPTHEECVRFLGVFKP